MKKRSRDGEADSINMANMLMLLSRSGESESSSSPSIRHRVFECKTCNRQFSSFQALGGHRASHKKPRLNGDGDNQTAAKPRTHECSICGLEFAIGQALGGHMRRHRAAAGGFVDEQFVSEKKDGGRKVLFLDLNLPPSGVHMETRPIVFGIDLVSKTPVVDCFQ